MLHWRFISRQIATSEKQALIFILCVALSLLTLVSLGGFSSSVRRSILKDARQLHAADIIIHSHYPFSRDLVTRIEHFQQQDLAEGIRVHEFYSMARNPGQEKALLSQIKAVEEGYPFYGEVKLASGRKFSEVLQSGSIIVERELLNRLGAQIGELLQIGETRLTIADIVIAEPDRPVSFFSFGPRIFVHSDDLDRLGLIREGSRIRFDYLLKVHDPAMVDRLARELSEVAVDRQENVRTFRTAESGVRRFFDNFLFFLNLIGIFTLLLAGIGIQTSLYALLRDSEYTIAVMKSVGATSGFITAHFIALIMILGGAGTFLGLGLSSLLQLYLPTLFAGILPAQVAIEIAWKVVVEGVILGAIVVGLFSSLPLQRLKYLKPGQVFRKQTSAGPGRLFYYTTIALIVLFFMALVIWQLDDFSTGIFFVLALFALVGVTAVLTQFLLLMIRNHSPRPLAVRQAFRGLFRPGNATRSIIITLSASLAVIFSISLVERNLQATFVHSYPPGLPNAYFIDIQPSQKETFSKLLDRQPQFYPIVRGRLISINDQPVRRREDRQPGRDSLTREFNLTYRDFLLDDEQLDQGNRLFGDRDEKSGKNEEIPVSVLDTVADLGDIRLGDLLVFKVQGIPLKARVKSIRTRTASRLQPYFYFIFPDEALKDAPQTFFSAVRMSPEELTTVQDRLADRLPNLSVIDIGRTVEVLAGIMRKLSAIIQFFTSFSIIAGLLIIISSIFATRLARIREAVYFKILGADTFFILRVFTYEKLMIAAACALLAALISQIGSWIVCERIFAIAYSAFPGSTLLMMGATVVLVIGVGLSASVSILRRKPAGFLRDEGQE